MASTTSFLQSMMFSLLLSQGIENVSFAQRPHRCIKSRWNATVTLSYFGSQHPLRSPATPLCLLWLWRKHRVMGMQRSKKKNPLIECEAVPERALSEPDSALSGLLMADGGGRLVICLPSDRACQKRSISWEIRRPLMQFLSQVPLLSRNFELIVR